MWCALKGRKVLETLGNYKSPNGHNFFAIEGISTRGVTGLTPRVNYVSGAFLNYLGRNGDTPNPYIAGTIVHELGHQLDKILVNAVGLYSDSERWQDALLRDTLPSDSRFVLEGAINTKTCSEVFPFYPSICNERLLPSTKNWELVKRNWTFGDYSSVSSEEIFPNMFEHCQSLLHGFTYSLEPDLEHVLLYFPQLKYLMLQIIQGGKKV